MRLVVPWLREFVDLTASPEELGRRLEMLSFELSLTETVKPGSDPGFTVLEFEIKANRPDVLNVVGLAREAATAYSLPLKPHVSPSLPAEGAIDVSVTVESPDLCPRYAAAVADVTIAPSPAWLAARLQAAGVRPINNVVDVTNYVLLEIGQPMHAFDLDKLEGKELRIRRAVKGERITTLDGTDRALDAEMLVIADGARPQAVAGVMGGGLSEVNSRTRTIVLESAFFEPKSVRSTSKRLSLKTEASARFERGTDVGAPVKGLERAIDLLQQIGAGSLRGSIVDRYPAPKAPRTVTLRASRIERILGQSIDSGDVQRILTGLGFTLTPPKDGAWAVTVPTYRVDVLREIDLIEEVGRHHGYDRLPATFPALSQAPDALQPRLERDRLVRRVLLAAGCSEALTFSFIDAETASRFAESPVPIGNPLSTQFAAMRPSLIPGLLASVAHNRNRQRPDVRLFELGSVFTAAGESRRAAVALTGDASGSHWSSKRRDVDFFDVKGIVERLGEALGVELAFVPASASLFLAAGRAAAVAAHGQPAGVVGMVAPAIASAADAGDDVYIVEIDLDALSGGPKATPVKARPLPRFPSVARDISIIVDETLPAEAVRGTIRSAAPGTLASVREFDRYQGKGVPERRVSLSLRLTFRSLERTLTDAEVQTAMDAILAALIKDHHAVQR